MKFNFKNLANLLLLPVITGSMLVSCGGTSGNSGTTPSVTNSQVSIDAMTVVPVINGSATRGTLYIHNYSNVAANGLSFNVDQAKKSSSKFQSLLASLGFKSSALEANNGFSLLNPELCGTIPAGGSCALNFMTPNLTTGNKGSSSVSLAYQINGKSYTTNQIVNYQYVSLSALSGVNFTGDLTVTGAQGSTQHVVGYVYAGGTVGSKYNNVNLKSSSLTTTISNGFINGQEVAVGQVIPVEFAVNLQGNHDSGVNVVPEWSGVKANNRQIQFGALNSGSNLNLTLIPSANTVNYIFGMVPVLNAPATTPVSISVTNNGNAAATAGITATSDNPTLIIDDSDCQNNILQANAANACTISFSESSATPSSAVVTFKNSAQDVIGTQTVIWTNNLPIPAVYLTPNPNDVIWTQGQSNPESSVVFLVSNVGNAPLNSTTYPINKTGPATWIQDGTTCGNSISANSQCSISGHFVVNNHGVGLFYLTAAGSYESSSYRFVSSPIRYMVTASPDLAITPAGVNMTVMANGVESKSQTYTVTNQGSASAVFTGLVLNTSNTQTKPTITSGTCTASTTLAVSANCTVVITYGPESASYTANEAGTAELSIDYHGGTPDTASNAKNSFNYNLIGNDSYVALTNTSATSLTGNGMESNPFRGNPDLNPMLITFTYTNQSVNYPASNFNLNTNNLPYGVVVESAGSTCTTGVNTMSLAQGASCDLVLKLDRSLLSKSPSGGSIVLNFTSPQATWTTPLGFYSAPGNMIYVNYLQPTVVSTLSNNNGSFESTVLTMTAANESSVANLTFNVKGVSGWLESTPTDASANCTVNNSTYAVSCDLKTTSTASVKYIMPTYLQAGQSANIPLVFSTSVGQYAYLDPEYMFINYQIPLQFLIAIGSYDLVDKNVYISYDNGTTWAFESTIGYVKKVAISNSGMVVSVGGEQRCFRGCTYSGFIYNSLDAVNWTQSLYIESTNFSDVTVSSSGKFIAVGAVGGVFSSTDGTTWVKESSHTSNSLNGVISNSTGEFVAVGTGGTVIRSTDGSTWQLESTGISTQLNAVTVNSSGKFIAVGNSGAVISSTNGTTWQLESAGVNSNFNSITVNTSGRFVAVGASGAISVSDNGSSWQTINSGTSSTLNDIAIAGNGNFVAVGVGGIQLSSALGLVWNSSIIESNIEFTGIAASPK